jgi:phosphoenolpyruvate carboxykinase (GTP)
MDIDKAILDDTNLAKLEALDNPKVMRVVEEYVKLCKPAKVTVITDLEKDIKYVRELAIKNGEETKLAMDGHTIHFDGPKDQGRDKENTKILLPKGKFLGKHLNSRDRDEGLADVLGVMDGIMEGKEMLVAFFCLGPQNSKFSISALQMTDSSYVVHSESMLYREGYAQFKNLENKDDFFYFLHSAGELGGNVTKNVDKRRIYMDLEEERVFTVNNQYAGNSVGLKKLALRLAISKAAREDWLCEHMFVMGIHPQGRDRVTYFTGAFPSACGKTSTAMVSGQSIIGDDIAYLKKDEEGKARAVNVERGIFGIIKDVSAKDDPVIFDALTSPREVIFSNVLMKDGKPYWINMGQETPKEGVNYSGEWQEGKKDANGKEIKLAHPNSRYTMRISELSNADPKADDPEGVVIDGVIYGGRDSNTSPPVTQSLSWSHGVFLGAALESETTTATIGQEGVLKHDPMANLDFLVIPFGTYIENHLKFGDDLDKTPLIFATNYFLKEAGEFLNDRLDKKAWLLWMEGRVHGEYKAIETPVGYIPIYGDLKALFETVLSKEYSQDDYNKQFSIRVSKNLERLDRVEGIYKEEENVPEVFMKHIEQQRQRLLDAKEKFGKDVIAPSEFGVQ